MNKEQIKKIEFERYETKCVFCGRKFLTIKNTANEGICYGCRTCGVEE